MPPPDDVLALARSFTESRLVLTAVELDLFTHLDNQAADAPALAARVAADTRALTRLLDSLVVLGLLAKEQGRYQLTPRSAPLSAHHPESVLPMARHINFIWGNWSQLTETVRKGRNQAIKTVTEWNGDAQRAFIGAMHVVGRDLAREIAAAYDLSPFRRLLDIGGASGSYTIAFLRQNTGMTAVLFDLEPVIPLAAERLRDEGLLERVELAAGDFYHDELPSGCDLALLSAIIHQNSPEENLELYRKIYRALTPGGVLLIRDHIMDESRTQPPAGALFAINMLVNTRGGDTYTFPEVQATLTAAGFADVRLPRTGEKMDCLVEARKPR